MTRAPASERRNAGRPLWQHICASLTSMQSSNRLEQAGERREEKIRSGYLAKPFCLFGSIRKKSQSFPLASSDPKRWSRRKTLSKTENKKIVGQENCFEPFPSTLPSPAATAMTARRVLRPRVSHMHTRCFSFSSSERRASTIWVARSTLAADTDVGQSSCGTCGYASWMRVPTVCV
jgi:hypothetical protein